MASLCHPWLTTTNLPYKFPIFETSATALCGTTGIKAIVVSWATPSIRALRALGDKQTGSRPVLLSLEADASQRKVGSHPAIGAPRVGKHTTHGGPLKWVTNGVRCGLYCPLQGVMICYDARISWKWCFLGSVRLLECSHSQKKAEKSCGCSDCLQPCPGSIHTSTTTRTSQGPSESPCSHWGSHECGPHGSQEHCSTSSPAWKLTLHHRTHQHLLGGTAGSQRLSENGRRCASKQWVHSPRGDVVQSDQAWPQLGSSSSRTMYTPAVVRQTIKSCETN